MVALNLRADGSMSPEYTYVEYFGDKYGKQTDNHRYADVYIGQMLWAFLTQENF